MSRPSRRRSRYPPARGDFGRGVKRGAGGCLGWFLMAWLLLFALAALAALT